MGKRGLGYGSEDHLRRYLAEREKAVSAAVGREAARPPAAVSWLPFPRLASGVEREFRGLEFLEQETRGPDILAEWRYFWPSRGQPPMWDAVGRANGDWLLVEAKANHPEFCSPPTTAKAEGGLPQIRRSLNRVKRDLGVHRFFDWTGTYYQYANRLAALWFLREHDVPARLVFVYFTGDVFRMTRLAHEANRIGRNSSRLAG